MPKKGVRVTIIGKPRPKIDVEAMTQIIIALGREFAQRKGTTVKRTTDKVATP
jgi:hypothetical protein